jgi:predicted nucleic acid-binding Zn ribbon protein
MTLTKAEYDRFRGDASAPNGTAPTQVDVRGCEVCGTPLKATQKQVCSPPCAGRLHSSSATSRRRDAGSVTPPAQSDALLVLLAALPPEVVGLDLAGGWRCVRA